LPATCSFKTDKVLILALYGKDDVLYLPVKTGFFVFNINKATMTDSKLFNFSITPEVLNLGFTGGYLKLRGLQNKIRDEKFEAYRQDKIKGLRVSYSEQFIQEDSFLEGFRQLHTKVGRSNKKYVSSPENLIGMLLRNGTIPSINLIVDIYNLVSLETRLALGAHDISKIDGNVTLRLTNGTEKFLPLGKTEAEIVASGEYSYIDDSNEVICRLEYRQVEKTKVTLDTKNCFYIIQGNAATPPDYIHSATLKLMELTKQYCGGEESILWKP